jgi:hypothetical protein
MPVLVQWITSDKRRHDIGEELRVRDSDSTSLSVRVPNAWAQYVTGVEAVGYDERISLSPGTSAGTWGLTIANDTLPGWLYVEVQIDGAAYYGDGVCADGGDNDDERVWSSPVWFDVTDDLDGDGYAHDVDCNDNVARINPGARDRPGNGTDENCDGVDATRRGG